MEEAKSLTSLPTDNLYKFLTILGLALVVTASFAHMRLLESLAALTGRFADIEARFSRVADSGDEERNAILREASAIKGDASKIQFQLDHFGGKVAYLGGIGVMMSIVGFVMWYRNHQKWQDIVARELAAKAVREAAAPLTKGKGGSKS